MRDSGRIGLKFCGGCNPQIDRSALVQDLRDRLPPFWELTTEETSGPWETALLLCGCPTACADRPEIRALAGRWILVAGRSIDYQETPEDKLSEGIVQRLFS